jgi:hypothetical protein
MTKQGACQTHSFIHRSISEPNRSFRADDDDEPDDAHYARDAARTLRLRVDDVLVSKLVQSPADDDRLRCDTLRRYIRIGVPEVEIGRLPDARDV